jgi:hypothetical protein
VEGSESTPLHDSGEKSKLKKRRKYTDRKIKITFLTAAQPTFQYGGPQHSVNQ